MPFSSLMFLQPTPPRVTRRSRLENIWLLILRCLVLCLLALGFARPFFARSIAPEIPARDQNVVAVLVDDSASMRRQDLWSQATARVKDVLQKFEPSDHVTLMLFDRTVRRLVDFDQWSAMRPEERADLSVQQLAARQPGWSDTHLGHALLAATESIEEFRSHQTDQPVPPVGQVIVVSDFQEGAQLDGLQGYEWPRQVEVSLQPVQAARVGNAGLHLLTDTRDESNAQGPRLRVDNSTDARHEQFRLAWTSTTPPATNAPNASPAAATPAAMDVYVPPGHARVVQTPADLDLPQGKLALSGDDESFDNTVYYLAPEARTVRVLYLGREEPIDAREPLYYLERAFQQTSRQKVEILTPGLNANPTGLADAQLAVLADPVGDIWLQPLRNFVQAGHTLIVLLKSTATVPMLAGLLNSPPLTAAEVDSGEYAMLAQINFEHPLFAPFADPRYSDFTKIHFWKHRQVDLSSIPQARVLARFDNGDPALAEIPVGNGTILVFTSGWQPQDSQLALSSKFVPLLYSVLGQSSLLPDRASQYLVGEPVPLVSKEPAAAWTIRKPDGTEVRLEQESRFAQTDLPGIYTATTGRDTFRFAVNVPPSESQTAPLDPEYLERLGVPVKTVTAENPREKQQAREKLLATETERRQKLWRWLILASLAALIVETWFAGRLARRAAVPA